MRNIDRPLACVMGDMDLVRPLGLAGIRCAAVAPAGAPPRYSRFSQAIVDCSGAWEKPAALVDALIRFASAQPVPPALFYEEDGYLLLISRHRDRLAQALRFIVPEPTLVEDLVDKARFQALASRLALPVPAACRIDPREEPLPPTLDLRFPVIVKPLTRRPSQWAPIGGDGKATRVNSATELRNLWPRLAAARIPLLVQELVPGGETEVESYHVYVDRGGAIVADFTGKKIRTYPQVFGDSTALTTTHAGDVRELGREIVRRLDLRGVAKFDFKRAPDGRLYLFEINPRFTLWNHLGAIAGLNIPELVYCDLAGLPRPRVGEARAGVRWCRPWQDVRAAREAGMSVLAWLSWALACDVKSTIAWDDPFPFFGAVLSRGLARLAHSAGSGKH
jgi:D-aspartate ligase